MAQNGRSHPRKPALPLLLAGVAVIGFVVWLAWFVTGIEDGSSGQASPHGASSSNPQTGSDGGDQSASEGPGKTTAGKRPGEAIEPEDGAEVPQFPLLDQVLSDDRLSHQEAAARLLEIVSNRSLSLLEREEALAHGLDLDLPRFLEILADPQLPQPLAQRFFDEMLNYNEQRDLQVRACIALMDHKDPAMRQEATEQLAFYIGLEESSEQPDVLKQEAQSFLEDLAQRPKPQPVPVDPDAGIPDTTPSSPPQNDDGEDADL